MRRLAVFLILLYGTIARAQVSDPLVDLDAAGLTSGPLTAWKNSGSLGGQFVTFATVPPDAANVGGRKAVTFGDGRCLVSTFATPDELIGAKPFSLAVWAFEPPPIKSDVMVSWASRPMNTAEFGYGLGQAGAFFGWDKGAGFAHVPAAGQWHHIAYTGAANDFRVYVDGSLDVRRELTIAPKAGGHVQLGAGRNAVDHKPLAFFHGSLARVEVWGRSLSQREVRNAAGWYQPFNAFPADATTVAAEDAVLRWEAGSERARFFVVRQALTEAAANAEAADPADVRTTLTALRPIHATPGVTCYWRVDQFDAAGQRIVKGAVWRFTVDCGPATRPAPRDRVAAVRRTVDQLSWVPGRYATSQTVYFGADENAVTDGSAAIARSLPPSTTVCPIPATGLEYGKTYYWRVAETNGVLPSAPGPVWAFRTEDQPIPDDVTFFAGSDCHYGLGNNDELNRTVIDEMNWLPGTALPKQLGWGTVRTPRGLVLNGDLLDKGFDPKTAPGNWAEFTRDYGLLGDDGRLAYPVYEGFGNHDGMTGPSASREGIRQRNKQRRGLTMVSANGFHYSWDWDQLHLVQLNLFPGKDSTDCVVGPDPEDSLGFLKEDLAKNVGGSGHIVFIFCHYCYSGGMSDWWTPEAKDRFYDAIKGYRVVLIHGHSHGAYTYHWKGMLTISDGSTAKPDSQTGDFMVVHVTSDGLTVAQRKPAGWGVILKASLPGPTPALPASQIGGELVR